MLSHIIDTHSHYDDPRFDGVREELIDRLFSDGIAGIIHAATDIRSSQFGIDASRRWEKFYTSVGIHPENAVLAFSEGDGYLERLKALCAEQKVVAIGEIGLDYHYEGYDRDAQIKLFREQTALANSLDLPVIVHCRDAAADCMAVLKELRPRGVMHCFSGSPETAREVLDLGMYISFTGVITFKNAKKPLEVLKKLPAERLLLETDCPYMAPEPMRGKTCDSSMIPYTAARAAEVMGMDADRLIKITEENAKTLFRLP